MVIMKIRDLLKKSNWKLKAIKRTKEINSLKKRNKELIISRDKSKVKNNRRVEVRKLFRRENI